jgi:3-hydroxypropanoate dehydrogenase
MQYNSKEALNQIFLEGRTHRKWLNKEVPDKLLYEIYDIAKMGPTSANCCPMRIIYIKSEASKNRLKPFLDEGNIEKTMTSPVTAIIAYDLEFYKKMSVLAPHLDVNAFFNNNDALIYETAFRNSSLQGAYFIIAARSLGLDCGPISGFDAEKLDKEFFPDSKIKTNFLCNLGCGDLASLRPRATRLSFDEACKIF